MEMARDRGGDNSPGQAEPGPSLSTRPAVVHSPLLGRDLVVSRERVENMLLGLAIGDALGFPVVTDDTDPNPKVTWSDSIQDDFCNAERFDKVITRTWRVRDRCGNVATCTQVIDVVKAFVDVDLIPGQCPNVLPQGCQPLRVAILGRPDFHVSKIIPS